MWVPAEAVGSASSSLSTTSSNRCPTVADVEDSFSEVDDILVRAPRWNVYFPVLGLQMSVDIPRSGCDTRQFERSTDQEIG